MSDTPETDQLDLEMRDQGQMTRASYYRNKCRDLERRLYETIRERDNLIVEIERLRSIVRSNRRAIKRLEKQTNDAHNKAIYADVDVSHIQQKLDEAIRERDELQKRVEELTQQQDPFAYDTELRRAFERAETAERERDELKYQVHGVTITRDLHRMEIDAVCKTLGLDTCTTSDEIVDALGRLLCERDRLKADRDLWIEQHEYAASTALRMAAERDQARAALREAIAYSTSHRGEWPFNEDVISWRKAAGMEGEQ